MQTDDYVKLKERFNALVRSKAQLEAALQEAAATEAALTEQLAAKEAALEEKAQALAKLVEQNNVCVCIERERGEEREGGLEGGSKRGRQEWRRRRWPSWRSRKLGGRTLGRSS